MAESYLVLDQVAKSYPRPGQPPLRVLDGLDVAVEEGALLSILGPSGCGKSTLLNIINGLDDATSGTVLLAGKEVTTKTRSGVKIGMVFQQPRLLNWRSVRENVALPLREMGLGTDEIDARVRRYLDIVGLSEFSNYYPLQLSGGMQQRVSLARGLAIEPDLLLADEPFSALDEISARKLRQEFLRIWDRTGTTILFVTHNIREAVFLSTRMLVITARPARVHLDLPVEVPYPRRPDDDALFELEKSVTRDFMRMEEETGLTEIGS
ncbi:ABC transporter ATP-binding protein [Amycolatopsis pigmentata]|uniref:ABC transporter ATP-binding protein n=1 Tax=Amycolatopsis pigmentata TaxID=450801 RepID=A0ABW5FX98_9PSEU